MARSGRAPRHCELVLSGAAMRRFERARCKSTVCRFRTRSGNRLLAPQHQPAAESLPEAPGAEPVGWTPFRSLPANHFVVRPTPRWLRLENGLLPIHQLPQSRRTPVSPAAARSLLDGVGWLAPCSVVPFSPEHNRSIAIPEKPHTASLNFSQSFRARSVALKSTHCLLGPEFRFFPELPSLWKRNVSV